MHSGRLLSSRPLIRQAALRQGQPAQPAHASPRIAAAAAHHQSLLEVAIQLQREMYLLATSPSGRARPLGEVVERYISLKTGRSGSIDREAFPYADQCVARQLVAAVLTKGTSRTDAPGRLGDR